MKKHNKIIIPLLIILVLIVFKIQLINASDTEFEQAIINNEEESKKLMYFGNMANFGTTNLLRDIIFGFYNGLTFIGEKIDEVFVQLVMLEWTEQLLNDGLFKEISSWYWLAMLFFVFSIFISLFNYRKITTSLVGAIPRLILISSLPFLLTLPFVIVKSFASQLNIDEAGLITKVQMSNTFDLLTTGDQPIYSGNQKNKNINFCNQNDQKYENLSNEDYVGKISNFKTKEQWNSKCNNNTIISTYLIDNQISTNADGNYVFQGSKIDNPAWPFENLDALRSNVYRYGTDDFGMLLGLVGAVALEMYLIYFAFLVIVALIVDSATVAFRLGLESDLTKAMQTIIRILKNTGLFSILLVFYIFYVSVYQNSLEDTTGTQRIIYQILLLGLGIYFIKFIKSSSNVVEINKAKDKFKNDFINPTIENSRNVVGKGIDFYDNAMEKSEKRREYNNNEKKLNSQLEFEISSRENAKNKANNDLLSKRQIIENSNMPEEEKTPYLKRYDEQIKSNNEFYEANKLLMNSEDLSKNFYGVQDNDGTYYSEKAPFRKFGAEKEQIEKDMSYYNTQRDKKMQFETFKEINEDNVLDANDFALKLAEKRNDPNYLPKPSFKQSQKTNLTNTSFDFNLDELKFFDQSKYDTESFEQLKNNKEKTKEIKNDWEF